MVINALPLVFRGSMLWVAALVGEEIFDSLQRQMMDDPELQPIVQRLMRIHVTEEARHIQFARDGCASAPSRCMRRRIRFLLANVHGVGGPFYRYLFTNRAAVSAGRTRRRRDAPCRARQSTLSPDARDVVRLAQRVLDRSRFDGSIGAPNVAAGRIPVTVIVIGDRPIVGIPGRVVAAVDQRRFDNATDTWTVTTLAGDSFTARALVNTRASGECDHRRARATQLLPHSGPSSRAPDKARHQVPGPARTLGRHPDGSQGANHPTPLAFSVDRTALLSDRTGSHR